MPLKPLPYREVKRKLEKIGFFEHTQKGSHVKFVKQKDGDTYAVIVPNHREVAVGTLRSIIRQAGLTPDEFEIL